MYAMKFQFCFHMFWIFQSTFKLKVIILAAFTML